jgi:hypothetical protein
METHNLKNLSKKVLKNEDFTSPICYKMLKRKGNINQTFPFIFEYSKDINFIIYDKDFIIYRNDIDDIKTIDDIKIINDTKFIFSISNLFTYYRTKIFGYFFRV